MEKELKNLAYNAGKNDDEYKPYEWIKKQLLSDQLPEFLAKKILIRADPDHSEKNLTRLELLQYYLSKYGYIEFRNYSDEKNWHESYKLGFKA